MIPFLREDIIKIPNAGIIPAGIAQQTTIDSNGNITEKKRPTHDASSPRHSKTSVNSLCDKNQLDPCVFAFCLIRILHMIHILRVQNPSTPILIGKYDLDAAYR